ncbi:hypothetical protein IE81DRAFT_317559 [Ceraceosorus guamensis]|uniref:P-loop containing nucleoside triphosphate hydrolase protein n=1 Tax=Ceraceosorus guamensis TaxID=1522189 RepID=A0A316VRR2_9BASI|nr:hypothetical protein IE81DRAFT_317559 [Ceraceosorus guamensis]PWN39738.1 hypothetical protein IE81DRAFT_317559 [Ceraceosorus guamensis]
MYSLLTGLYRDYSSVQTRCVLLLGPSQSGKTVLLTRIKAYSQAERAGSLNSGVKVRGIAPTVGQNVHTFQPASSRIQLRFWDLGGSKALRAIWPRYFKETHVIVWNVDIAYWIDSSDAGEVFGESQSRLEEAEPSAEKVRKVQEKEQEREREDEEKEEGKRDAKQALGKSPPCAWIALH